MRTALACLAGLLAWGCASHSHSEHPARETTAASAPTLDLDRLLSGPPLTGSPPSAPSWAPDGTRLAFRWQHPDDAQREIWLVDADGTDLRRLTEPTEGRASVGWMAWLPDGDHLLYTRAGELRRTDLDGDSTPIARLEGGASDLAVSPDGRRVSFLREGDLWLLDLATGTIEQVTDVAMAPLSDLPLGRYHRRDVEIGSYVWGGPTYAWSPDSRTIAVHHVDRRALPAVPFPHYLGDETDPNPVRRSYPGQPNERRTVGILDLASGALRFLDLPDPTAHKIIDFSWSKDGLLLIDGDSDTAEDRRLHVFDPSTDALRELWHDHRATRVYTDAASAWHPDGAHVVILADLADRYGLYALSLEDPRPRLLTDPAFDVTGGPLVTDDGAVFYDSNEPSPYERHVFRTALDAAQPSRVTDLPGEAVPHPSPDGSHVAFLHSSDTEPPELFVVGTDDGARPRRITDSRHADVLPEGLATPRYVTFPSRHDAATLHARILEPPHLEPGRHYPVLFGPVYSNTVRNRWGGFYGLFQQLLVARGYVVVQVDVRGSTGYGREFREQFLGDFAGRDLDDLESAVLYLESLPYVDPERIGIWGSSYGGTLTVYSLLKKPGLFDAGVACAAAVDPYFFGSDDVAIVRTPDTLPEAFARGAARYAANLEDPLLLIHGMQDQVVPFKTVVDLAEALMRAGKDFDFAFAPAATHGWTRPPHYARYLLGKLLAHFERYLRPRQ